MTQNRLWQRLERGDGLSFKVVRFTVVGFCLIVLLYAGTLALTWPRQAVFALLLVLAAWWIDRSSSYLVTLTLVIVSMYTTFRYAFWRVTTVARFFHHSNVHGSFADAFFVVALLCAELYAVVALYLGYAQTLWPLRRTPVPLPDDPGEWPAIDLLIPTYTEPLSVVRSTVLAALQIDWPADKLNVVLLDDGNREEFRTFARDAGVGYIARGDNLHAKAGNINHALKQTKAPLVAVFDSDHIPTRSFLQVTIGWFLRDANLGMLQTPHHFYSPDPFERNLGQFRAIPNEGELFYGIVQAGNDFWNAAFFCGSCAVLRRSALDEIGGMAVETVTEDAHTSLRLQMRGWNTAYINIPQAAGLATDRLSGHIRQRIRWARGMVQILRTDNPLFARGLKLMQRLCYFNAMMHYLYALPRFAFLFAPLVYLIVGRTVLPGYWAAILAYALPHLVLSSMTNARIQGQHRHSFWNEIYETVLAPYILLPTLVAIVSPKSGSFHVTAKGGVVSRRFFDLRLALPSLLMIAFNLIGLLCAIPRFVRFPASFKGISLRLFVHMYDGTHRAAIVMNLVWTVFNLVMLGVGCGVAWESQQRRKTVRVSMQVPVTVELPHGIRLSGVTADVSSGGVMLHIDRPSKLAEGASIRLQFNVLNSREWLPAVVVRIDRRELRAHFAPLTIAEEEALVRVLYSRADTWLGWREARETDQPLKSFARIVRLSFYGFKETVYGLMQGNRDQEGGAGTVWRRGVIITAIALLVSVAAGAGLAMKRPAVAQQVALRFVQSSTVLWTRAAKPGSIVVGRWVPEALHAGQIALKGVEFRFIPLVVQVSQSLRTVTLHLRSRFSQRLLATWSVLPASPTAGTARSVGVLLGAAVASYRIGVAVFRVQVRPLLHNLHLFFSAYPASVVLLVLLACLMLALFARVALRRHARLRLQGEAL